MCGITGYFCPQGRFNPALFGAANHAIKHRGPDDFGYITIDRNFEVREWEDEELKDFRSNDQVIGAFGFRRLSIVDLSDSGHQPMCDISGRYWIIYNGEVYNYLEIREELISLGYQFKSSSDTEVVLNAYRAWGKGCLQKFNGMWAFCIFDRQERKLFCARDRLGIKPFYYCEIENRFAFSSEIKQLLALFPDKFNKINRQLAFDFLAFGSYGNESNETYFNGISKLNAGAYLEVDLTRSSDYLKFEQWWSLPEYEPSRKFDDKEVFEKVAFLFQDSVRLRLRSDVPLGTALSGGLDSSGIVSVVDRLFGGDAGMNRTFTISSDDPANDDMHYASKIINAIPVTSYVAKFEDHADLNELGIFSWHQEEPLQTASIFGSWQLYRFIKNTGIKVALDGQGADELMGGYNRFPYRRYLQDTLMHHGISYYKNQVNAIAHLYNSRHYVLYWNTMLSCIYETARTVAPYQFYQRKLEPVAHLLHPDMVHAGLKVSKLLHRTYSTKKNSSGSLIKNESFDLTKHTNLPGILRQVDRNSMAHSVESRLPFLDYRLVEYLYTLPVSQMIREGYTKFAYRNAMKGIIPEEVLWRKTKLGFKMPEFEILHANSDFVKETLSTLGHDQYMNKIAIEKNIETLLSSKNSYHNIVWRLLCFGIWKEKFGLQ